MERRCNLEQGLLLMSMIFTMGLDVMGQAATKVFLDHVIAVTAGLLEHDSCQPVQKLKHGHVLSGPRTILTEVGKHCGHEKHTQNSSCRIWINHYTFSWQILPPRLCPDS